MGISFIVYIRRTEHRFIVKLASMKFLLLIASVILSGSPIEACDIEGVLKCWTESSVPEISKKFASSELLKTLNAQYAADEYCSAQEKLDRCMQAFKDKCQSVDTLSLDTIISAGKFLCTKGKQDFINHFHCLMSRSFQNNTLSCMNDIMELVQNVSEAQANGYDISHQKCSAAEEAFTCIEGKTQMSCGDAAKEFVHHYLEATIQPLMKGVTCNHSHSPNEYPTTNGHQNNKHCTKYCYKYPETSITPVLESTKIEMDEWCTANCKLGNCPENLCTCDCQVPTQVLVCEPVQSKFAAEEDGATWCHNTCTAGHCPEEYCKCHILYSLPRPITSGWR
ncbi:uncharacterized protein LOC125677442 [Ostrea edulis]|uniref:uncharacterized protein LOC125677442 n=1 Tax=Ostrea edulis TaxID=37623 RepID=UPI0020942A19|nr:uncharacterized protein LOC125677442 [Ostrea edulis]